MPVLALLPSPLLGPAVWAPVAQLLHRQGWPVVRSAQLVAPRTPEDVLAGLLAALPSDEDLVLVPHSNAGLYVPALTAHRRVVGAVFVDAGLPPSAGAVNLAPPAVLAMLAAKADEAGLLPPWTQWWDPADLDPLFPDLATRAAVEREQPRLPLSYFHASLPVPAGWDDRPGAYLAFGDTYATERATAAARGWPVRTLVGDHLHHLIDPPTVATELLTLLAALGLPR